MKYIIKTIIVSLIVISTFLSCSKEESLVTSQSLEEASILETRSIGHSSVLNIIDSSSRHRSLIINQKNIHSIVQGFINTKVANEASIERITPIRKRGRDLAYAIDFKNGGWAIIAGISPVDRSPVLALSESGYFDKDKSFNPEESFWLETTMDIIEQAMIEYQNEEKSVNRSFTYDDPYVWVRFILDPDYSTINNYSNLDHLIVTKWGQGDPWNYKAPSLNGSYCPVGCTAVAVGQMLYYLHNRIGKPSGLYHSIFPTYYCYFDFSGYYFESDVTRSNYISISPRWASMATINPGYLTTSVEYVGDLLIDIADRADAKFRLSSTSATLPTSLFSSFGISCTKSNYSESTVINSLNDSIPVIVGALVSNDPDTTGHVWIIDGYNSSLTIVDHPYKWRMVPPDSLSYYSSTSYDYVFTEREMQQYYPDVIEDEIIHEYTYTSSYLYRMNWGWHDNQHTYLNYYDDYDNRLYSYGYWDIEDYINHVYTYNYNIKIYHSFN
ncbi:MAG: C10 family peptidase [Bacteroidales bacterium]|nr:C10 family peptidase [Bacteroidales bacterium]